MSRGAVAAPLLALALCTGSALPLGACAAPARGTIGAVLSRAADGRVTIHEAPPGLAAADADLEPGDEILLVDGEDVRALSDAALHRKLGGGVGTPVKLTLVRGEEVIRVTLKRTAARKHKVTH